MNTTIELPNKLSASRRRALRDEYFHYASGRRGGNWGPFPISCGTRRNENGEYWSHWALYRRSEMEALAEYFYGDKTEDLLKQTALEHCGWIQSYSGPGRSFNEAPWVRLSRSYVLVRQFGGLDI